MQHALAGPPRDHRGAQRWLSDIVGCQAKEFNMGTHGLFTAQNRANSEELNRACCLPSQLISCLPVVISTVANSRQGCLQLKPQHFKPADCEGRKRWSQWHAPVLVGRCTALEVSSAPFVNVDSQALVTPAGHALHLSNRQVR